MSNIWRPYLEDDIDNEGKKVDSYSPTSKKIILSVKDYIEKKEGELGLLKKTASATGVSYSTVRRVNTSGAVCGKSKANKRQPFSKLDSFAKDVIRRTVYAFYDQKIAPTLDMIHDRIKEEFPYGRTTLYHVLRKLGFRYCKANGRSVVMESARLQEWRYNFLRKIRLLRKEGWNPIYLDETWYDTHDVVRKCWDDKSEKCVVTDKVSKGKRVVICHAGSRSGFVPSALLLAGKNIKKAMADYHEDMNGNVFERWFQERLLPNLPPKSVIIMDNAKYHSRIHNKIPTMANLKQELVDFLKAKGVAVPEPPEKVPTKMVLIEWIKCLNIKNEYIVDRMAVAAGHQVLRLPPYHCCFNAIEMVWAQLKNKVRRANVYSSSPEAVIDLIRQSFNEISQENWSNYIDHVEEEEDKYWERDHIIEECIEPVIIALDDETDDEFYDDGCGVYDDELDDENN